MPPRSPHSLKSRNSLLPTECPSISIGGRDGDCRTIRFDAEMHNLKPKRRCQSHGRVLSSTLFMVCRDLERRELWDISIIQSFGHVVHHQLKRGQKTRETVWKSLSQKLENGVAAGKHLLAGALSAALSKTLVAPIERVRMDIVLNNTIHGPMGACMDVLKTEGMIGFWRGNMINIIRTAPFKAVNFYAFDVFSRLLVESDESKESNDAERFLAGALAGAVATMMCFPLDTIRTRMLSTRSSHQYANMIDAFRHIVQNEGFSALYKGCIPGLLSIVPGSAVFYGVYGTLKESHIKRERQCTSQPETATLPPLYSLLYGAIAGMCTELVVYPLEVVRRQIQLQTATGIVGLNPSLSGNGMGGAVRSISTACHTVVRTHGFAGFYAGCLLNMIQVLPGAALSYFTYEAFKAYLKVEEGKGVHHDN